MCSFSGLMLSCCCGLSRVSSGKRIEARRHFQHGRVIGFEVVFVAGQQETALSGFRVLDRGQQSIEGGDDLMGMNDPLIVVPEGLDIEVGDPAADQKKQEHGHEAKRYTRIHPGLACRSGKCGHLFHQGSRQRFVGAEATASVRGLMELAIFA